MDTYLILYITLGLLHLSLRSEGCRKTGSLVKILLMPVLILYVFSKGCLPWVVASLGFATIGDALLIKGHTGKCFLFGMGFFALVHLSYSLHLLSGPLNRTRVISAGLVLLIIFLFFVKMLTRHTSWVQYALYALNLCVLAALCAGASVLGFLGALAFILSDSMIALDSLGKDHFSSTSEMTSYILAQLLLVLGFTL